MKYQEQNASYSNDSLLNFQVVLQAFVDSFPSHIASPSQSRDDVETVIGQVVSC